MEGERSQTLEEVSVTCNNIEDSVTNSFAALSIRQSEDETINESNDNGLNCNSKSDGDFVVEIDKDNKSLLMLATTLSYWLKFHVLPTVPALAQICETLRKQSILLETVKEYECKSNENHTEQAVSQEKESDFLISEEGQENIVVNDHSENTVHVPIETSCNLLKRIRITPDDRPLNSNSQQDTENSPSLSKKFKLG